MYYPWTMWTNYYNIPLWLLPCQILYFQYKVQIKNHLIFWFFPSIHCLKLCNLQTHDLVFLKFLSIHSYTYYIITEFFEYLVFWLDTFVWFISQFSSRQTWFDRLIVLYKIIYLSEIPVTFIALSLFDWNILSALQQLYF